MCLQDIIICVPSNKFYRILLRFSFHRVHIILCEHVILLQLTTGHSLIVLIPMGTRESTCILIAFYLYNAEKRKYNDEADNN